MKVPPVSPWTDDALMESPVVLPVVRHILHTDRLEVDTFSFVTSRPDSPHQHWHADTSALFKEQFLPTNLPAHALVMFMPLVNVTAENKLGGTKFLLGR